MKAEFTDFTNGSIIKLIFNHFLISINSVILYENNPELIRNINKKFLSLHRKLNNKRYVNNSKICKRNYSGRP